LQSAAKAASHDATKNNRGKGSNMEEDTTSTGGLIKSPQDFVGGVALLAITVAAYIGLMSLGSMRGFQFGSGTAPRLFCLLLGALSLLILISSFTNRGPKLENFPLRGPLFILSSVVFFGATIRGFSFEFPSFLQYIFGPVKLTFPGLGLAVSGVITVLLAGAAIDDFRLKEGIIFAVSITAFCAFLFPFALGQPIPLWPTFLQ
jgi:putative tricarboxylic transport membrane protein